MAERLNVTIRIEVTDADTGEAFWADAQEFSGVSRDEFLWFQGQGLELGRAMHGRGMEKAAAKAGKGRPTR